MPARTDSVARAWARAAVATLAALAVAEAMGHGPIAVSGALAATVLILALTSVVYAALTAGFGAGAASAVALGVFGMHFVGGAGTFVPVNPDTLQAGGFLGGVGLIMASVIAALKRGLERSAERRIDEQLARQAGLEASNQALREANSTLEAFTFVVSHDLKEPVRAIEAYLRFLDEDHSKSLPDEGREMLTKARGETERLRDLLNGLLEFSRAARGEMKVERVDVAEAVAAAPCRAAYEKLLAEKRGTLVVDAGIPVVQASRTVLCQVLGNFIGNALRHNPNPDPRVRVRGARRDGFVEIVVEDNGPGFPPALVDRFTDLMEMPPSGRGGFGLIIARRGVERHGGRMWLDKADGGGAAVHITLPAAT